MQRSFFEMLMDSQWWTPQQMRNYQRRQLASLLRHARSTVPFYATRLDAVLDQAGNINWDRWIEIPTVERRDLIERRVEMQSSDLPASHGRTAEFSTSGTTGAPVITTHNASATLASAATSFRFQKWHDLDTSLHIGGWSGTRPEDGTPPDGIEWGPWGPGWLKQAGRHYNLSYSYSAAEVLEMSARRGVSYFTCGGTDSRLLAQEARRLASKVTFKAVLTRSSELSDSTTDLVRQTFGARAIPTYSSKEGYRMAHQCPEHQHFHVNSEIVLLEVIDANGRPCVSGQTGEVIITPLFSAAQPLIRYRTGDFATPGVPCSCGRGLPVLNQLVGRTRDLFRLPDGRSVTPRLSPSCLEALHSSSFQIAQLATDHIEVRYSPAGEEGPNEVPIRNELVSQTHPSMKVTFRRVPSMVVPGLRKHSEYVCELMIGTKN